MVHLLGISRALYLQLNLSATARLSYPHCSTLETIISYRWEDDDDDDDDEDDDADDGDDKHDEHDD